MTQRRLRPSQGGKFMPAVVPEILTVWAGWSTVDGCTVSDEIGLGIEEDVRAAGFVNRFVSYSAAAKLCTEPLYDVAHHACEMCRAVFVVDFSVEARDRGCCPRCREVSDAQRKYVGQSYLIDENDVAFGRLVGRIHNVTRSNEDGRLMIWFTIPRYGSSGAEYVEHLEDNESMRWFQTRGAR